jgi:hypothetical protein
MSRGENQLEKCVDGEIQVPCKLRRPSPSHVSSKHVRIFLPGHLTKTGQERLVPLTQHLRQEFQRLRTLDGVLRIQGLVFHKNGKKRTHTYRDVQRLCEEQKIKDLCSMTSATVP